MTCYYRTRSNGTLAIPNHHPDKVDMLYALKDEIFETADAVRGGLTNIIALVEANLFCEYGSHFDSWIVQNGKVIRESAYGYIDRIVDTNRRESVRIKLDTIIAA